MIAKLAPASRAAPWLLLVAGAAAAIASGTFAPQSASEAAQQTWPAFVLVAGLLLIGLVADEDRLFAAAGRWLAGTFRSDRLLFVGLTAMVAAVTAVLNLDTSVAFLTPVVVHAARVRRGRADGILVCGCLLFSNAGSLLLPGSNLTNLIVLGPLHLSGGAFFTRMALSWAAAVVVTAGVVAVAGRAELARDSPANRTRDEAERVEMQGVEEERPILGLGLVAVMTAVVLVLALRSPAVAVLAVGAAASLLRVIRIEHGLRDVWHILGLPVLLGLFGIAVSLGTAGRQWAWPAHELGHLDSWATGAVAAAVAVVVNNLPAAALLSAKVPAHPYSLLVGLNLGPNLFATGSLAWVLWMRAARSAGAAPPVVRTARLGLVAVPLSVAAALGALLVTTPR